ncbi:MAG: lipoxygenase, partial [Myxococcales bacterium]|nr:lipoxygenase [Myxococcales bacterium]
VEDLLAVLAREQRGANELMARCHRVLSHEGLRGDAVKDIARDIGNFLQRIFDLLLSKAVEAILSRAGLYGRPAELGDYARQFQSLVVPDDVADVNQDGAMTDEAFAAMRLAGPNPVMLRRIDAVPANFPVDAARFAAITKQDLAAALAASRVYLADYAALSLQVSGTDPAQKYASAPLALFALDENRSALTPVAIQCGQTPSNACPVFYADEGRSWELAKIHVQSADGNYHELISHLGLTHLLVEPFVVATHRNLAQQHPLFLLLLPHMQGTAFINNAAINSLIAPGGTVDKLLAGTIESDWAVSATALTSLDFNGHMLKNNLKIRGVDDPALLPDYPYRDDALLLWDAIEGWVGDYLDLYYDSDADVVEDEELQAWYRDLISPEGGTLSTLGQADPAGGEGRGLFTVAYLKEVVTMVIFTGSVQHAGVNFPQRTIMSYAPAMPLATYAPPPVRVSGALPADAGLAHLPPLQMGLLQVLVGELLGGVYFTRLGDYDRHQRQSWFTDRRVDEPLAAFHSNLVAAERTIGARNLERAIAYDVMLPSRVPQSINI